VCTVCAKPGDPIPVWEVRLCKFCVVRQLINKSALFAFSLTPKEIEVLRAWKTYVYDLGMHCTFYLRSHLDHLRRQKYSDPQIALDKDVEQRQSERFSKENARRKRKQREQDDSYTERTKSILKCFSDLKLKPDLNVMEEWWFPKELKLEIQEIMAELRHIVVPRVSRLMELNSRLMADGIAVDKLRMELDLKTRRIYDDFVLGGMPIEEYPLTAAITRGEILAYFTRERIFESAIISTWYSSITNDDFLCCHLERPRFLRDAREWWARRGKKPPPEKCGELYLARVRKRQAWLKNDMSLVTIQENWRRELLERKLKEKIDWYFTELPKYIATLRNTYELNLKRRMKNREIFWMKGLSSHHDMIEPPEKLKPMYCDYEDFIKNCNGFCPTEDGYCGCLEYAAKDIIRANTILRRRDWMDAQLKKCQEINYRSPDLLLCPEAKEEYYYAAR
ncbi:6088_t:CDS:2, partial [Racocetra persica]